MATYNYTVTASGNDYYLWNGHGLVDAQNPDLFFRAGDTLTIVNTSGGHLMRIIPDNNPAGAVDASPGDDNADPYRAPSNTTFLYFEPVLEGAYTYVCTSHPAMTGSVTVSRAYANEGPEDGYGTGPLIGHDDGPISMNEIRTKINEIITKGGVGTSTTPGGSSISVSQNAPDSASDGDLWWDLDTASLYVYLEDRSAWIQTNGAVGGGGGNYESDWNSFPSYTNDSAGQSGNRAEYDFTHNLGSELALVQLYIRKGSSGEVKLLDQAWGEISGADLGWTFLPTDENSGKIRFFEQILVENDSGTFEGEISSATLTTLQSSGYEFKIVASAGGGGGGGASSGGDASIEVSATAPDPAEDGDLWFNTTQAELYVYVDAENAWIQTNGGGGSGGGNFSTGWVNTDGTTAVANLARLTFNHNLGTTDLNFSVYAADDSAGTNSCQIPPHDVLSGGFYGAQIEDLTNSSFVLQFSKTGFIKSRSNSSSPTPTFNWSGKYIKVVASAGGGGAGPRAYVAFDGTSSNLTGSITNSFNVSSITDVGTGYYQITYTNPISNPIIQATCCTINNGIGEVSTTNNDPQSGSKADLYVGTNRNGGGADAAYVSITVH